MKTICILCLCLFACGSPPKSEVKRSFYCQAGYSYAVDGGTKSGTYIGANDCCAAWAFKCEQSPGDDSCLGYADQYYHLAFKCIYAYSESEQ